MADDWRSVPPDRFADLISRSAAGAAPDDVSIDVDLEQNLIACQKQGLEANLRRQWELLGDPELVELQVLGVRRGSFEKSFAAHATSVESAIELAREADGWSAHGIYVLCGKLRSGVETRLSAPGTWFEVPKGEGTKDSDVDRRLILAVDFDVSRPSSTSATREELDRSIKTALSAWGYLSGAIGDERALAYLHSGNGRQIHMALDALPNDEETKSFCSGVLVGMASLFDSEQVKVDTKLFDAKRILPACGTVKKKGAAGIADRPHRRTAIFVASDERVRRLSLDELKSLARKIWNDTDEDGRSAMSKALGIKAASPTVSPLTPSSDSPFARANAVSPAEVAVWLGVYDGTKPICPGCGETKGVAVLNKGFKCSHNRCQDRGRNGFRTNVDLVAEVRGLSPRDSVIAIAERFDFEVSSEFSSNAFPNPEPASFTQIHSSFKWVSTSEIFEPLPPTNWLVKDLQLVAGRPTMLVGYGFSGKTLMAQSLSLALASGSKIWGKFEPSKPVLVRHLDYEQGRYATLKRYQRISVGHGIPAESVEDRLQVCNFPEVYLDSPNAYDVYARSFENTPVVVLDALRGATPSLDENDSKIRRCVDILSRVSEKTGVAFFMLHHSGKNSASEEDVRKLARGSSAIFDGCGTVFVADGGHDQPKRIRQAKAAAEAEGGEIPRFHLLIHDVATPQSPTGGLRILWCAPDQEDSSKEAQFDAIKQKVVEAVGSNPHLMNPSQVAERVTGRRSSILTAIKELLMEGKMSQPGGQDTPFVVCEFPVPSSSHTVPEIPGTGSRVPTPLRGNRDTTRTPPPPPGNRERQSQAEQSRRLESDRDADVLMGMPVEERLPYIAAQGWSDARSRRARGVVKLREKGKAWSAAIDAAALEGLPEDADRREWANEQGWSESRTQAALNYLRDGS